MPERSCETCGHLCKCGRAYCPNHRTRGELHEDARRIEARRWAQLREDGHQAARENEGRDRYAD